MIKSLTQLAGRTRRVIRAAATVWSGSTTSPRFWGVPMGEDRSAASVDHHTGLTHSAAWRGVNKISNSVARTPFVVHSVNETGGMRPATTHAAYRALRFQANGLVNSHDWKKAMTFMAVWWGNAISYIQRDSRDNVVGLWLCRPESVGYELLATSAGTMEMKYVINTPAKAFTIDPSDVFHVKGLSVDGIWGLPFIEYIRSALGLGLSARKFGARFFEHGANGSGILYMPEGLEEENEEAWIKSFRDSYERLGSSWNTIFLKDGAKYEKLTIPPETAQFLETRQFSDREVANFLGLPPASVGVESSVSYNSFEMSKQFELDDGIAPWFAAFEAEADAKLLTPEEQLSESYSCKFRTEELMRVDFKTKHESLGKALNDGVMVLNEVRARLHLPLLDDELANVPRMPKNIGYIDSEEIQQAVDRGVANRQLLDRLLEPASPRELQTMAVIDRFKSQQRRSKRWATSY